MAEVRIGTSGWSYEGWRGAFYPRGLRQRDVLAYAARRFNSVEVNGSFYALQRPETFRSWYEQTPPEFVFAIKGSRFITHNKKLRDIETPLANFFASGLLLLKEKLGPIVWQLPATARFDADRLAAFFALLPRDTRAAARLARRHDARVAGRSWTQSGALRPLRHALEVRNEGFFVPELAQLARRFHVALVVSDAATWPRIEELTAEFVYVRLHGAQRTYASGYDDRALDRWAARLTRWRDGSEPDDARRISMEKSPHRAARDVYVYFDNDFQANAPNDARRLAQRIDPNPRPRGAQEEATKDENRYPSRRGKSARSAVRRRSPRAGAARAKAASGGSARARARR